MSPYRRKHNRASRRNLRKPIKDQEYIEGLIQRYAYNMGTNINILRKERGLTLDDLCVVTGYSKGHVSAIINGRESPSFEFMVVISRALKVPFSSLFRRRGPLPKRVAGVRVKTGNTFEEAQPE